MLAAAMLALAVAGGAYHQRLTAEQLANGRPAHMLEGTILVYVLADGTEVRAGTVLTLGPPTATSVVGAATSYGTSPVVTNHTVTASAMTHYAMVQNGTPRAVMGKAIVAGLAQMPSAALWMAPGRIAGAQVKVEEILLRGTERRPMVQTRVTFLHTRHASTASNTLTITDLDAAIQLGEIRVTPPESARAPAPAPAPDPAALSPRDDALARLRMANEYLQLQLIDAAEYDALKAELSPMILGETSSEPAPSATVDPGPVVVPSSPTVGRAPDAPTAAAGPTRVQLKLESLSGPDGAAALSALRTFLDTKTSGALACLTADQPTAAVTLVVKRDGSFDDLTVDEGPTDGCVEALFRGGTVARQLGNTRVMVRLTAE